MANTAGQVTLLLLLSAAGIYTQGAHASWSSELLSQSPSTRLLLLSSSRVYGSGYLQHAGDAIVSHFANVSEVLFVPYALMDYDDYEKTVADAFERFGLRLRSIHHSGDPLAAISRAEALFIGGGNSFRLLKRLYDLNLILAIRARVLTGMPYMGSSAGTNMACPTLRTSNDMPIKEPPSFNALGFLPFQINPHYIEEDPDSPHQGETRAQRLEEFLEENDVIVAALREGSWLEVAGDQCFLRGKTGMVLFQRGCKEPLEIGEGADLSDLMKATPRFDVPLMRVEL